MSSGYKYARKEAMVSLIGACVICLIIFFFIEKGSKPVSEMFSDVAMGVVFAALICAIIQFPMRKKVVKEGKVSFPGEISDQASIVLKPGNKIVFIVFITIAAVVLFACGIPGLICLFAPQASMPRLAYVVFKSLMTGCGSGYATYYGTVYACLTMQNKLSD